MSDRHS